MKLYSLAVVLFFASSALGDGACTALAKYEGIYKQVNKTCSDQFGFLGTTLEVVPYSEKTYSGYWIRSNGMGFGPTTSDGIGDVDKCTVQANGVLVEISANDTSGTVLPHKGRIAYLFSDSAVAFTADGCTATYIK